ncbi:kinase-like domain-containing protein [Crepidotus variabilis]|uniref:Kinase-like domain-containing protein n=1 Tax=Crepidotus variabilis TaxID=179855 RepID=A0A9P6EMS7_9AGAR|nr:kinase-like domain-containing protein [Crepidotus variabilis]
MLSTTSAVKLFFGDDEWIEPKATPRLYRAASVGSWGVTSIGRGFDWDQPEEPDNAEEERKVLEDTVDPLTTSTHVRKHHHAFAESPAILSKLHIMTSPTQSQDAIAVQIPHRSNTPLITPLTRSPSSPRPRRRSSQQRVSLVAGKVLIAPIDPAEAPPVLSENLRRTPSSRSFLSQAESVKAPSQSAEPESFLGGRNISEYLIEGEIGRGAYGLVKRAREFRNDGSLGPPLIIKQVIKSRILADCWKKHPKHGTIPIEIYVMSAISNTSYVLPPRRPWDPSRSSKSPDYPKDSLAPQKDSHGTDDWLEGKIVKGHPNICPLLDFFEDNHYYYLILPSTTPVRLPNEPSPPSDLFDLVETYPQGLPPAMIRTYLGQIADAAAFLHSHGIVHRDIKDENVVLGSHDKCILIDFGSSGLVKKTGWDTFSGTLDYAGPEILRGERYFGKEQDVWAFGVVAYVLLVGECPFMTAAEAQDGLQSPFANASIALDERCGDDKEKEGEEGDGGGALGDAASLVRACLQIDVGARPTFERILQCRFLSGQGGWS